MSSRPPCHHLFGFPRGTARLAASSCVPTQLNPTQTSLQHRPSTAASGATPSPQFARAPRRSSLAHSGLTGALLGLERAGALAYQPARASLETPRLGLHTASHCCTTILGCPCKWAVCMLSWLARRTAVRGGRVQETTFPTGLCEPHTCGIAPEMAQGHVGACEWPVRSDGPCRGVHCQVDPKGRVRAGA